MKEVFVVLGIIICMFVFFVSIIIGMEYLLYNSCNQQDKMAVTSIGICNKDGTCGVQLENGSFTTTQYPVIGKKVCK